ncbi:sugar isomerase [Saccharopolyspora sp. NFXS83]|uniref:polysaccharide lyase n=1 Tax=Saccharopolyspora sp. NFXS83 TaxID=2993560 RepID=UPI00224B1243|nr:sugar isomerase [Saccharopolyspora sp. NFXS83]MCX2731827.1 sugar isomerase [Saccharopolyspora sp. NFXS83]
MSARTRRSRRSSGILGLVLAGVVALPATAGAAPQPWTGDFGDFPGGSWEQRWGVLDDGRFGFDRMSGQDGSLEVFYGQGSSAPSCEDCPSEGGGQFYTDFDDLGREDLSQARELKLSYQVRFPADYDFGKGGKLPGLYGGPPGEAGGGNHGQAWSTRFMWRNDEGHDARAGDGEVYVYDPSLGDGYGEDVGRGAWQWQADDQWHAVEQSVDRDTGRIVVRYDDQEVLDVVGIEQIGDVPFAGIFFSTFFGGHATEWGPDHDVRAQFRDFQVGAPE